MTKTIHHLSILLVIILSCASLLAQNHGDTLRQETRLDQVYQQYNLSGQGVIVAMIERGIDYTHPDFIDANGKTRIAYIYDMIDQTGANAPGNTYGIGTIYTRAQIDQALANNTPLGSTDRHGHGTACTGIACGDGSGVTGAPFRGVASGATIIAVKVNHDAFPARGNVPAQAGFYDPTYLPIALDFVKDKSEELGLPSVSLINLGSIGGPTDGTSTIARAMADFAGDGRILVCGSGDDGGSDNRAMGQLDTVGTTDIRIKKVSTAGLNLRLDFWYHYQDHFELTILAPNGTSYGPYMHTGGNYDRTAFGGASQGFFGYFNGQHVDFDGASNNQKQMLIDFRGDSGTYTLQFRERGIQNPFYASVNPSRYSIQNRFLDFVAQNRSICDFAAAENIIVPNSYVLKNTWTDINGVPRGRTGEGDPGELWAGSSAGPTRDGRLGVDFSVPGEVNVGAYSPDTYYGTFPFLQIENSNGLYGIQNAVSGAAPVAVGVIALMLEVNPNLSPQQAKQILQQTARSDNFTGAVPNERWGYGKLDAFGAVQATYATVSNDRLHTIDVSVWPNPVKDWLYYSAEKLQGKAGTAQVFSTSGKKVGEFEFDGREGRINLSQLKAGVYFMQVEAGGQQVWTKLVKVD